MFYFLYTVTTGIIVAAQHANNSPFTPGTGEAVVSFAGTEADAALAVNSPQWFLITGSPATLQMQPYWTVTTTATDTTAGEYTLTATLNNPPSTVPTTATFTLAGGTITADISSDQATATIALHPSVAMQPVTVQVSASGTVSGSTTINSGTPQIGLQLIAATSSAPATVAPAGTGSLAYLRQTALGLTPQNLLAMTTLNSQNLAIAVSVGLRTLVEKVIPWAQQTTWSPLSLTTAEGDGLNALSTQLIPYLLGAADLLDSAGNPIPPVAEAIAQAPQVQTALATYAEWVSTLSGLQ